MSSGYTWMPIGWNGMNLPTIMCVCMPIGRVYFKARAVKKDSVPDMIKVELTYVPIKGGIVYSDVNRFFYSPGQALVLPPYDVEIVWCGIVSSLKPVCMDGSGFLQVFPVTIILPVAIYMFTLDLLYGPPGVFTL